MMASKLTRSRFMMVTAILLGFLLSLLGASTAKAGTIFPWLDYTLDVAVVSTDPTLIDIKDVPGEGLMLLVKVITIDQRIKTDDIKSDSKGFVLRDGEGDEHEVYVWRVRGVGFNAETGLFSTQPEQDAFELLYYLEGKTEDALNGAVLVVPTDVANEKIIVPLDERMPEAKAQEATDTPLTQAREEARTAEASFVIGGIRYTISNLDDEPSFAPWNRLDGKDGHLIAFSYSQSGKEAEQANAQLYTNARLIQPNGDLVQPYSNSDDIGNPYELYFGLSNDVILADCVFTIQGDEGEVLIPLSEETKATFDAAGTEFPANEDQQVFRGQAPMPSLDNDDDGESILEQADAQEPNTFSFQVGGTTYEMAVLLVAYDREEKQMSIETILYGYSLTDFISSDGLILPFGCGIISSKDGFLYTEGISASISTPMHLTFYIDTKHIPELVCFGKLNAADYAASEDFALVDASTCQYVSTFPIAVLMKNAKRPDELVP